MSFLCVGKEIYRRTIVFLFLFFLHFNIIKLNKRFLSFLRFYITLKQNSAHMYSFSLYLIIIIGIAAFLTLMMLFIYCVRLVCIQQRLSSQPMHIFVITQPHQPQYSSASWTRIMEQQPPSYDSSVETQQTNATSEVFEMNE